MISSLKKAVIFLGLGILLNTHAQENLNFENLLKRAKQYDPSYQIIELEKKRLRHTINQQMPVNALNLEVSAQSGFSPQSDQDTLSFTGELSKEFIETGTSASVSYNQTQRPDREEKVTRVLLQQSLLNNVFGRNARLQRSYLQDEVQLRLLQLQEDYELYIEQLLKDLFDYQLASDSLRLSNGLYQATQNLERQVQSKYRLSIANKTELAQAQLATLLSYEAYLEQENMLEQKKAIVANRLGLDEKKIKLDNLNALFVDLNKASKNIDMLGQSQLKTLRIVEVALLQQKVAGKVARLARLERAPSLQFVLGYSIDDSVRFNTAIERRETLLGLNLSLPIGNRQTKANASLAKIDFLKSSQEKNKVLLDLKNNRDVLKAQLKQAQSNKDIAEKKVSLLEQIIKDEERRYRIGSRSLMDLIELRKDFLQYSNEYQQAQLNYTQQMIVWLGMHDMLIGKVL